MNNINEILESKRRYDEEFNRVTSHQDGSHGLPHAAFFVGGKYHGLYMTHDELMAKGNGTFTPRWSEMKYHNKLLVNLNLEDQPIIDGYLSPMWDYGYLRYETQEVYDMMFD